jgi:protein required for attachment to host cells
MVKRWIVVAESSRARIFTMEGALAPLRELEDLSHPEARLPGRELKSDRSARVFRGRGQENHPGEPNVEPKQQEAIQFARQISERLEQARTKGELEGLVLIAPPAFLGLLRQNLSAATEKHLVKSIDKNLVQMSEREIREYVVGG